jgi:head-tail adaptor
MTINSGMLDTEVRIYERTSVSSSFGKEEDIESLFAIDWAMRRDLSTKKDSEREMNNTQKIAYGITQFTLRFRTDIMPTMTIIDEDNVRHEIVGTPIYHGRRDFVSFNCEIRDNV